MAHDFRACEPSALLLSWARFGPLHLFAHSGIRAGDLFIRERGPCLADYIERGRNEIDTASIRILILDP